ncbi:MAG: tRNA threonylcarbamoyladenosine dehydratase [Myxococcota bacterium]
MPLPMADLHSPPPTIEPAPFRTHRRFDRAARLFGEPALGRLAGARVVIFGIGGVGSFTAEALARSGVGALRLVDFDRVCITNTNRQLHAVKGTVGREKVDVMAERLRLVHPACEVEPVAAFYEASRSEELLEGRIDYVVDAIDNLSAKAHLVARCLARGIPLVSSMGAAARLDPTAIAVADLCETKKDPFAKALRKLLRKKHGLALERGTRSGVKAVYSTEAPREPIAPAYDAEGFRCVCPGGPTGMQDCHMRRRIDGTASFVTGAFGLAAASVVVRDLGGL